MSDGREHAKKPNSFGLLYFVVGLVFLYFSWGEYQRVAGFLSTSGEARGTVVDIENLSASTPGSGRSIFAPVVEYTHPKTGGVHTFTSSFGSSRPGFEVGEEVEVFFRRNQPNYGIVNSFGQIWGGVLLRFVPGVVFLLIGLVLLGGPSGFLLLAQRLKGRLGLFRHS